MKKVYRVFCKAEEYICGLLLCAIVALAFMTAVGRCINHPISWTMEISQFLLAWLAFLGADLALRNKNVIGVDILTRRMPVKVQAVIRIVMDLLILVLLIAFIIYGYKLCMSNVKRSYQTVGISYSWATASLPVASVSMCITEVNEILEQISILRGKEEKKEEQPV